MQLHLFLVVVAYGFGLASLINFVLMKLRMRTGEAYMKRAERLKLLRAADADTKPAGDTEKRSGPLKIVILHPDLGIGGAERLILDMAIGLQTHQSLCAVDVTIVTPHHDPGRCFKETVDGTVKVVTRGGWLPASIAGRAKVLCATMRMGAAAFSTCWATPDVDVFIVDQVAAAMPLLRLIAPCTPILFYCHFPDQKCDPNRNPDGTYKSLSNPQGIAQFREPTAPQEGAGAAAPAGPARPLVHGAYRSFFDNIEALSMKAADRILCNSKFSCRVTLDTFPEIKGRLDEGRDVLYPAVAPPGPVVGAAEHTPEEAAEMAAVSAALAKYTTFVSINRYERKKDVMLAVEAFAKLLERSPRREQLMLVVAGGCDPRIEENVAYHKEIKVAAEGRLGIPAHQFMILQNIPDAVKRMLLAGMHALLYTPSNEHFGIVPVEAMMHGRPVIAVNLGGPCESVGDATAEPEAAGGLLCEPNADAFSAAMERLVADPALAARLGAQGKQRAAERFGLARFSEQLGMCIVALASKGDELVWETYGASPEEKPAAAASTAEQAPLDQGKKEN